MSQHLDNLQATDDSHCQHSCPVVADAHLVSAVWVLAQTPACPQTPQLKPCLPLKGALAAAAVAAAGRLCCSPGVLWAAAAATASAV